MRYIFMTLFAISSLITTSQDCNVRYYPAKSEVIFDCNGNDQTRLLIYIDTTVTRLINIKSFFNNSIDTQIDFKYDSLMIYKAMVPHKRFFIHMKYSQITDIKYKYTLDPIDPHRTLLIIYDASAL